MKLTAEQWQKLKETMAEYNRDIELTNIYLDFLYDFIDKRCAFCGTQSCSPYDSEELFGCNEFIKYLEMKTHDKN